MFSALPSQTCFRVTALAGALTLALVLAVGQRPATASTPTGTIAYAAVTDGGRHTEIHLIQPDGSGDHRIYQVPSPDVFDLKGLTWSPDATRLSFVSGQEIACSIFNQDVYSIFPDGSGFRRLTNPPACAELAGFQQGSVVVPVTNDNIDYESVYVYLAGAPVPRFVTLAPGATTNVTFESVADFGDGLQEAIASFGAHCWIGTSAADVKPGTSVTATPLTISGAGHEDFGAASPTWKRDSSAFAYDLVAANQVYQLPANPAPGAGFGSLLFPSPSVSIVGSIDWSPSNSNQLLYGGYDPFAGDVQIYLQTLGSTAPAQPLVDVGLNQLLAVGWLPDGSGFIYSLGGYLGPPANLFWYDLATKTTTQLTQLTDEYAAQFSISPDSQSIVFERSTELGGDAPVDLWIIQRDGSNPHLLVKNAGLPAWSLRDPTVPSQPTATVTPTPPATGATATPTSPATGPTPTATIVPPPGTKPQDFVPIVIDR